MQAAVYLILIFVTASFYTIYNRAYQTMLARTANDAKLDEEVQEAVRHYRTVTYLMLTAMVISIVAFLLCILRFASKARS